MNRILLAVTMLFLLLCNAREAMAYKFLKTCGGTPAKWASNVYAVSADTNFSSGPWRTALSSVVNSWNNNPSFLGYSISYGDTSVALGNGQSEVWWAPNPGFVAATYTWLATSPPCRYTEADIVFNSTPTLTTPPGYPWIDTPDKANIFTYGGNYRSFQSAAIHEFGHAGGLGHTANTYSVMGTEYTHLSTNGSIARGYVGEDASAGMVALYGLWPNGPEDVAVVHWRWDGTATPDDPPTGGYSNHCRTRIFSSAGTVLPLVSDGGNPCYGKEPSYIVSRGQTVLLELTYENLGKSTQMITNGYYLSADSTITTADQFLGGNSFAIARNTAYTATVQLVIPTNVTSGYHWLGAVVDYIGAIKELHEDNNATYVGIWVQ